MVIDWPDLLNLVSQDTELKYKASTRGGEWAGPCPFCGGRDRFIVWPHHRGGQWWCRQCNRGGDTIAYLVESGRITPRQAGAIRRGELKPPATARRVGGSSGKGCNYLRRGDTTGEDAGPPPGEWQEAARRVVEDCEKALWGDVGAKALAWLRKRGLKDETIRAWRLGYHHAGGRDGATLHGLYVRRGITIPWFADGDLWAVNVRRPAGKPKYEAVKGSRKGLFGVDYLSGKADCVIVEGELDVLLLWQEIKDLADVLTLGSASDKLGDRWLLRLLPIKRFWICTDNDHDGDRCATYWLSVVGERGKRIYPPAGEKDVSDSWRAGIDLHAWALRFLAVQARDAGEAGDSWYLAALKAKRDRLVERLNEGLALIDAAYAEGRDVANLCDHFERLLKEYEETCDLIDEVASANPPTWTEVTLDLPPDTPLALPRGRWRRLEDGTIRASFTRQELDMALALAEETDGRICSTPAS